MLIQDLDKKIRFAKSIVLFSVAACAAVCCFTFWAATSMVRAERNQIYVLDGDIPFLAERAELEANFLMEAKAHINLFHHYFFTLPPDDSYIKWTLGKSLYLADGSALKQKQALDESGFYNNLVSSSAFCTIVCDSITLDESSKEFRYYGTQYIKRPSRMQRRSIVTSGFLESVQRSENNPHGLIITRWKTIENKDLEH